MAALTAEQINIIITELKKDVTILRSKFGRKISYMTKWNNLAEKLNAVTENGAEKEVSKWQEEFRAWRKNITNKSSTNQQLSSLEQEFMALLQANTRKLTIGGIEIDNAVLYSSDDEDASRGSSSSMDDLTENQNDVPNGTKRHGDDTDDVEAKRKNLLAAERQQDIVERLEALEQQQACNHQPVNHQLRVTELLLNYIERQAQAREREIEAIEQRNELLRQTIEIFQKKPEAIKCFVKRNADGSLEPNASEEERS